MKPRRYLYHATTMDRLPSIVRDGLLPSDDPRWQGIVSFYSRGKIFFAATQKVAASYASGLIAEELTMDGVSFYPTLLRVKWADVRDIVQDKEFGDFFTRTQVPPKVIEAYAPPVGWRQLKDALIWFHGEPIELPSDLDLEREEPVRAFSESVIRELWPPMTSHTKDSS